MIHSRKLLPKFTQKILQTAFLGDEQIFKVKQLYNSHNDVVYVPKKRRKVEVPEERLFCETEAFPKQIIVSVAISKTGNFVESNTKLNVRYYCNVVLKKRFLNLTGIISNEYLFLQDGARACTAKLTLEILKDKKQLRLLDPRYWPANRPGLNQVDFEIW